MNEEKNKNVRLKKTIAALLVAVSVAVIAAVAGNLIILSRPPRL